MKILNYDSASAPASGYRQGHLSMPADIFRILICGPSNSSKTNILLHIIYKLLEFDKIFLSSKNVHQKKYRALLPEKIDPEVGYPVIEALGDEIITLEEQLSDNQKPSFSTTWFMEKNQNDIINYFINGRHRKCSVIYLTQTFYEVPQNIRDNCSHFCLLRFLPRENKRIEDELGVDHALLDAVTNEKFSFFYYDKPQKLPRKTFDEDI